MKQEQPSEEKDNVVDVETVRQTPIWFRLRAWEAWAGLIAIAGLIFAAGSKYAALQTNVANFEKAMDNQKELFQNTTSNLSKEIEQLRQEQAEQKNDLKELRDRANKRQGQ